MTGQVVGIRAYYVRDRCLPCIICQRLITILGLSRSVSPSGAEDIFSAPEFLPG